MRIDREHHFKRVFSTLRATGFLLLSDPTLPSVCSLITGEPLRRSWWSHPLSHEIFQVSQSLEEHSEVAVTKLISGKVTFLHKIFWSHIFVIGTAREPWQIKVLSANARVLLARIDRLGSLRTDTIADAKAPAAELEKRLLINVSQVHTESGMHAKLLESWRHWGERRGLRCAAISPDEARRALESRLSRLNRKFSARGKLPWQ